MPTTIEVNKQSVEALLGSGKSKPFVIPEYQRPYAWTDEQVETLFEDLWDFTATSGGTERESSYFLGSVVSYENEDGEQEIIDGQQRITSLFLLLRAIYTKLVATPASERTAEANNFNGRSRLRSEHAVDRSFERIYTACDVWKTDQSGC